jgi:hypothetical protein
LIEEFERYLRGKGYLRDNGLELAEKINEILSTMKIFNYLPRAF